MCIISDILFNVFIILGFVSCIIGFIVILFLFCMYFKVSIFFSSLWILEFVEFFNVWINIRLDICLFRFMN